MTLTSVETIEDDRLADLVVFARIEVTSRDVEPWADLLAYLYRAGAVDCEAAAWLVKLYNAYDDFGSAWRAYRRWPNPAAWYAAPDYTAAAELPCTQERRNLRGGRVLRHLGDYAARLAGGPQWPWLTAHVIDDDPAVSWVVTVAHLRRVWGVGRQTAFEWAEFAAKVLGVPLAAPHADLWESEGPRRSLQRLYGNGRPSLRWLDDRAAECRAMLAGAGVALSWEDFETIICDFNVMRDGRYYPGKHLAALKAEIYDGAEGDDLALLLDAFDAVVPAPWSGIAPGIERARLALYRNTGLVPEAP